MSETTLAARSAELRRVAALLARCDRLGHASVSVGVGDLRWIYAHALAYGILEDAPVPATCAQCCGTFGDVEPQFYVATFGPLHGKCLDARQRETTWTAMQSYFVGCDFADEQHPGHVVLKLACPPHTRVSSDLFATIASAIAPPVLPGEPK